MSRYRNRLNDAPRQHPSRTVLIREAFITVTERRHGPLQTLTLTGRANAGALVRIDAACPYNNMRR